MKAGLLFQAVLRTLIVGTIVLGYLETKVYAQDHERVAVYPFDVIQRVEAPWFGTLEFVYQTDKQSNVSSLGLRQLDKLALGDFSLQQARVSFSYDGLTVSTRLGFLDKWHDVGPITMELVNFKLSDEVFDPTKKPKFFIKDFHVKIRDQSSVELPLTDTLSMQIQKFNFSYGHNDDGSVVVSASAQATLAGNQVQVTFGFDNGYLVMKCKSSDGIPLVAFDPTLRGTDFERIALTGSFTIKMRIQGADEEKQTEALKTDKKQRPAFQLTFDDMGIVGLDRIFGSFAEFSPEAIRAHGQIDSDKRMHLSITGIEVAGLKVKTDLVFNPDEMIKKRNQEGKESQERTNKIEISVSAETDEFYPFKDIEDKDLVFGGKLNAVKLGPIKVTSSLGYIQKQGIVGSLQVEGQTLLGELLGVAAEDIKNNDILQTRVRTVAQIAVSPGKKPTIVLDGAVRNFPGVASLARVMPNFFNQLPVRLTSDEERALGLLKDAFDTIRIKLLRLVVASDKTILNEKTYEKGISVMADVGFDISSLQSNTLLKPLWELLQVGQFDKTQLANLLLQGTIRPGNMRNSSLFVGLGTGNIEITLPVSAGANARLKAGRFGMKLTGLPSLGITTGLTVIPVQGADPLELDGSVDFTPQKVGFSTSMVNIWTEPFGIKGFAFGDLGASWSQDYPTFENAVRATVGAVASAGVSAADAAFAWLAVLFLPTDIGLAGEAAFLKAGARDAGVRAQLESLVQAEYQKLLQEKRYQNLTTQQQVTLKEQIFSKQLFARARCGTKDIIDENIICAKIFLNIGKDFSNFGLDLVIDQPITLIDLINFVAQQVRGSIFLQPDSKNLIPIKLNRVALKFVPLGSKIGSITADQGLGAAGAMELFGKEVCFVMGMDWARGIIIKAKMPRISIGNGLFTFTGLHCASDPNYFVACSNKELAEFNAKFGQAQTRQRSGGFFIPGIQTNMQNLQNVTQSASDCEKGDPIIDGELSLFDQRLVVSGEMSLGKDIKGKADIELRQEGGVFDLNTKVKGLYEAQLHGTIPTVRMLVQQPDPKDIYIELVIKNTIAKAVKEELSKLRERFDREIELFVKEQIDKIKLPITKFVTDFLQRVDAPAHIKEIGNALLGAGITTTESLEKLVSIQSIVWKGTLQDALGGYLKTPEIHATILGQEKILNVGQINLIDVAASILTIIDEVIDTAWKEFFAGFESQVKDAISLTERPVVPDRQAPQPR
ncbi:hypothetical protein KJZ61_02175 [Candidatus Dependentiae bacterium]|nr:hypothetical protein [Candidatus Dependentiae bacterium]